MGKILVIGACGQLGSELTLALRNLYGTEGVVAADKRDALPSLAEGPFEQFDVLEPSQLHQIVSAHKIEQIYHLAAVLSAKGEQDPIASWRLNMNGLLNVLELARVQKLDRIYWPSSIAVFGPDTPKKMTPQHTIANPNTIYGISKLAGERWCEYYNQKYGIDVRSLRYPGLISYKTMPGGGTTDYAVEIYSSAKAGEAYQCFLSKDTYLPMMYMDDAIRGTIELMHADPDKIKIRSSYNIAAMSFSPEEIYQSIKRYFPGFNIDYQPDFRQAIADSWPQSIDDTEAREEWGWKPVYDLGKMTKEMIAQMTQESQV